MKKITFLKDASAKASTPPPRAVSGHSDFMQVFYVYTYMFLKQDTPEMDDFVRKTTLVLKEISIF